MDWNNRLPCAYDNVQFKSAHHFMLWLYHSDPNPADFCYKQKKGGDGYNGSIEGENIKCDFTKRTYDNCVKWCLAVYAKANKRETPGISVWPKIFYKGLTLDEIRSEMGKPKQTRTPPTKSASKSAESLVPTSSGRKRTAPDSFDPSNRSSGVGSQKAKSQRSNPKPTKNAKAKGGTRSQGNSTMSGGARQSHQRSTSKSTTKAKVRPEIGDMAGEANVILADISKLRGAEGMNEENYAKCAQILDMGAIPQSAQVDRLTSNLKDELDFSAQKPMPYPDSGKYFIEGDLETCLSLSELFSVCPKELYQSCRNQVVSISARFSRNSEVQLPGREESKFLCASTDSGWAAWARIEGSQGETEPSHMITIWSPDGQTFGGIEEIRDGVEGGSLHYTAEELELATVLVLRLKIRVESKLAYKWWKESRASTDATSSKNFSTLLSLLAYLENPPANNEKPAEEANGTKDTPPPRGSDDANVGGEARPDLTATEATASGSATENSAPGERAEEMPQAVEHRSSSYILTNVPEAGSGGPAATPEAQEEALNLARAFIETICIPTRDKRTKVSFLEVETRVYNMFAIVFPAYVSGARGLTQMEFSNLISEFFVGSGVLPVKNAEASHCGCDLRDLEHESEDGVFTKIFHTGLGLGLDNVSQMKALLVPCLQENRAAMGLQSQSRNSDDPPHSSSSASGQRQSDPIEKPVDESEAFQKGDRVLIHNLTKRPDINGLKATIEKFDQDKQKVWFVVPDQTVYKSDGSGLELKRIGIRGRNLRLLTEAEDKGLAMDDSEQIVEGTTVPRQTEVSKASPPPATTVLGDGGLLSSSDMFNTQALVVGSQNRPVAPLLQKHKNRSPQKGGSEPESSSKRTNRGVRGQKFEIPDDLNELIGMRITKNFVTPNGQGEEEGYIGTVVAVRKHKNKSKSTVKISYEDGDSEDMDLFEFPSYVWSAELRKDLNELKVGDLVASTKNSREGDRARFSVGTVLAADRASMMLKVEMYQEVSEDDVPLRTFQDEHKRNQPRFCPRTDCLPIQVKWSNEGVYTFGFTLTEDGAIEEAYATALKNAALMNP